MRKLNFLLLIWFILLAIWLNFIPHLNYKYPLHVDEWVHFQYANHLSNGSPLYFGEKYVDNLESGFHFLLATLNSIGIDYLIIFEFLPSIFIILLCLSVFILTRKLFNETAGVFSLLFIALLKSSVAILGPVFLVPMVIGMFFIAIGLFLVNINSKLWFIILASLLIIHPPSAMAFLLLMNIEFILIRKNYVKNIIFQILAGLIALPLYLDIFLSKGFNTLDALSFTIMSNPLFIPRFLGLIMIVIVSIGIYFSVEKENYSFSLYILSLLFFIFIFYWFKIEVFIPYARALMYLFLIFSIVFGVGCQEIINFSKNKKIQIVIGILLIILILTFTLPQKLESNRPIYQIIDQKDYNNFIFIKDNTPKNSIVLIDPWKANALTPIAERQVYSRIVQGPNSFYETRNNQINIFFDDKCKNLTFLEQNNINVIYGNCENSSLNQIHPQVYLFQSKPTNLKI